MGCDSSRLRKKEEPERPEYLEPKKVLSPHRNKKHQGGQKQSPVRGKPPKYRTKIDSRVLAKYDVKALIGKGSFSDVLRVENKLTKQPYAVKILRLKNQHSREVSQSELRALTRVRHPYVIQLMEVFESKECVYLVMELATGGELYERIKMKGHLTEKESIRVLQMVLDGVIYLHSKGITHRDLKPENLLFYHPGQDSKILITDFGFAKTTSNPEDNALFTTWCGTPEYIAPELLCKKPYTNSVDLWAIGVITYVMISGHLPFAAETPSKLYQQIVRAKYTYSREIWKHSSDGAKDFIDKLLHVEPDRRLKAVDARKDAWVNSVPPLASHKGHSSKHHTSQISGGKSIKSSISFKSPMLRQKRFEEENILRDSADNEKNIRNIRKHGETGLATDSSVVDKKLKGSHRIQTTTNEELSTSEVPCPTSNRFKGELLSPRNKEKSESASVSYQEEFPSAAATEDSNSFASRAEGSPTEPDFNPPDYPPLSPRSNFQDTMAPAPIGTHLLNRFTDDTNLEVDWLTRHQPGKNPLDFNSHSLMETTWQNPRRGELDMMFAPLQKSKLKWHMQENTSVIEKVGLWLEDQNVYAKEERLTSSHGDIDRINKQTGNQDNLFDGTSVHNGYNTLSAASSPFKHANNTHRNILPNVRLKTYRTSELSPQVSYESSGGVERDPGALFGRRIEQEKDLKPIQGLMAGNLRSIPSGMESFAMQRAEYNGNIFSD